MRRQRCTTHGVHGAVQPSTLSYTVDNCTAVRQKMLLPAAVRTLAGLATATVVMALLPVSCSEAPAAHDEPSLETRFEVSSEAYPTPKAPPPTEVTRATREEGDNGTVVASPEALKEKLQAKQAVVSAWESRIGLLSENVAQENAKKKEPFITGEKGIKAVSLTFFSFAFVALLFMFLYEFKSRPAVSRHNLCSYCSASGGT
uniref:Transmembrane protein n=1 Tax=Eimeria tenella TaxID=5802 RepID=H9B974_EIMTE|nr:hypothetical protein [Eimeria tenella]